MKKYLLTPNEEPIVNKNKGTSKIQLSKPVSFMGIIERLWGTSIWGWMDIESEIHIGAMD